MSQPGEPREPVRFPRDRYPRMILVCMAISAVLSIIIVATLVVDFAWRADLGDEEKAPPGIESLLEKPREAYPQQP